MGFERIRPLEWVYVVCLVGMALLRWALLVFTAILQKGAERLELQQVGSVDRYCFATSGGTIHLKLGVIAMVQR